MTVPIDGIILLQYTLMESRCAMLIVFFFLLIVYYTQLFRHQEVWLKVKVTVTKGLICKYQKLQCNTQMEVGKKVTCICAFDIRHDFIQKSKPFDAYMTMYLFYKFTGIDKCTH